MGVLVIGIWVVLTLWMGYPFASLLASLGRKPLSLSLSETLFVVTLLGTLIIGGVGLILLELGVFGLMRLAVVLLVLWLTVFFLLRGGHRPFLSLKKPTLSDGLALGVALIGVVVFFWPADYLFGGADAGVYVNLGAIWARTGDFRLHEAGLAQLPQALLPGLFREAAPGQVVHYLRFPGFYLDQHQVDTILPQFYPLHPLWLAIFNGLLGLRASLYGTALWATLGCVSVFMTMSRLFDRKAAVISGLLLALTPLQMYFARYPTAEPLTQYLTWAGLFGFTAYLAEGGAFWGMIAGLALGQVFLTRIDALPLLLIPAGLLLNSIRHRAWGNSLWFLVPFSLMLLQAVLQGVLLSYPYIWEAYGGAWQRTTVFVQQHVWLLGILILGGVLIAVGAWRFRPPGSWIVTVIRWGVACGVLGAAVFAYFIWPRTGQMVEAAYWYGGGTIPVQNHLNLLRLGWYLSPLGIWLAIGGIVWIILRENGQRIWPLLGVGLSFSFLYVYNILNNPFHIYAMRRYVPVVLPFFVAGIAYGLTRLWDQRLRWRFAPWIAGGLGIVLLLGIGHADRSVWNLREFRGLTTQLEALAERLPPRAVLLFDDAPAVGAGATVGTPLQYVFGFTAFDLQEDRLDIAALRDAIAAWQAEGRAVYWVEGPSPVANAAGDLQLIPEFGVWIQASYLEQTYFHFPTQIVQHITPLEFYRVATRAESASCVFPAEIDVGTLDSVFIQNGFYARELLGERSVRWTDGAAFIRLPCVPAAGSVTLEVTASAVRAPRMTPVSLTLILDDVKVGQWTLGQEFTEITLSLPGEMLQGTGHVLGLESDTWIPNASDFGDDTRVLGVLIDRITLTAQAAP